MTDTKCRQAVALFRYGLIAEFIYSPAGTKGLYTGLCKKAKSDYPIPGTMRTRVAPETLRCWLKAYRRGGFEALLPKQRANRGCSRVLPRAVADALMSLKDEQPRLSIPQLIRAVRESGVAPASLALARATVHRLLSHAGLMRKKPRLEDGCLDETSRMLVVSDEDRRTLGEWRNSKDKRLWEKAVTVLENHTLSVKEIAEKIERPVACVRRWIATFNHHGLAGLNQPRKKRTPGAREATFEAKRQRLMEILHDRPLSFEINRSSWSLPSLANAYMRRYNEHIGKSTVARIVKLAGYSIKKARKVLSSPDPDYREKVELVLGVLQNLKPGELFFFIDELGPLRVKRYGGRSFAAKHEKPTFPQVQAGKGSITMAGALSATANQVTWFYCPAKDTLAMINLLEVLFNQHPGAARIFVTWDAASWHSSNLLVEWLDAFNAETARAGFGPIIELVPLPTSSQFLDVLESVFSGMKRAVIHHSDYPSENDMKKAISRHFVERNQHFKDNPKRAGNKIWDVDFFQNMNNVRSGNYREW